MERLQVSTMLVSLRLLRHLVPELLAALFCLTLVRPVLSETIEDAQHAAAEMVDDLSDCAAYYTFARACAERESSETAKKAANGASQAFDITTKDIYLFGQMAKMSQAAMLASLRLATDRIKEETDNGCQNLPVVLVSKAKQCKFLVERPQDAYFQKLSK